MRSGGLDTLRPARRPGAPPPGRAKGHSRPLRCLLRQMRYARHLVTGLLPPILEEAAKLGLALMKVHGHRDPSDFSETDDKSDKALFPSVCAWTNNGPHGSAVMFPDGRMIARTVDDCGRFTPVLSVNVVGDDLPFWPARAAECAVPEFGRRVAQTFGAGTYELLRRLRVAVIGCFGHRQSRRSSKPRPKLRWHAGAGGPRSGRGQESQPHPERHQGRCSQSALQGGRIGSRDIEDGARHGRGKPTR